MSVYLGQVQGVILDWAGTAVDYGCLGPVAVFAKAFEQFGIVPKLEQIRQPMGKEKREHVKAMLTMPAIKNAWLEKYGNFPQEEDVDKVFETVLQLMPKTLADYAEPVPGCVEAMRKLREKNIKIGSCTGYRREMMTNLLPAAEKAGFKPDCLVTADEVPQGRPMPWMCWLNCMKLGLFPLYAVVKVGDTIADIEEGLNAGHWSVAVTRTSNSLGLTARDIQVLDKKELAEREDILASTFRKAGAHYVISSIADLPNLCEEISCIIAKGRRP